KLVNGLPRLRLALKSWKQTWEQWHNKPLCMTLSSSTFNGRLRTLKIGNAATIYVSWGSRR
ncbi:hypothetical protein NDU88_004749, partial [Pleurodeles waltl]